MLAQRSVQSVVVKEGLFCLRGQRSRGKLHSLPRRKEDNSDENLTLRHKLNPGKVSTTDLYSLTWKTAQAKY